MSKLIHRSAGVFLLFSAWASAADWVPIAPAELAQKTPKVDPAADAEAIFWDVKIEDRLMGQDLSLTLRHYIRIKIFTERGKEQQSTVEIARFGNRTITEIAGRTIKPDGTVVELKKDAIFDRQLIKSKGAKLSGKTFVLPNVEVGDIVEYRYRETRDNEVASHMRLYFQREIPLWSVTYHLKPLSIPWLPYGMRTMAFQCEHPAFQREPDGFYITSLKNVPAFKEEPNMPPEDQSRAWMLIYYEEDKKIDPAKYWKEIGKGDYNRFKQYTKADGSVKSTAAELIAGATKPEDQLAVLDAFCRTKIRNLNSSAFHVSAEERKALKENHTPGDTLKQKAGRGMDVNMLFAAMANAAGFDARMARVPDRGDTFFNAQRPTTYFISNFSVAVNVNGKWTFFDPATPYLESGMLRWQEEGEEGLVSDPKEGFFAKTQFLPPARSGRVRRAQFELHEDGSVEGSVTYTYTGHVAFAEKHRYEDLTPAQQEEDWKSSLQARLNSAEISDFTIQNITDPVKPVTVMHKVTMPGYATRTGKRILLQPAFFERNIAPRFTDSTRKWDMYFPYGWMEDDEVTIHLPQGWELDQPDVPPTIKLGGVGTYSVHVLKTKDGRTLIYQRKFEWGQDMQLVLAAKAYQQVKKIFDFVQEQDNYTISLKQQAAHGE